MGSGDAARASAGGRFGFCLCLLVAFAWSGLAAGAEARGTKTSVREGGEREREREREEKRAQGHEPGKAHVLLLDPRDGRLLAVEGPAPARAMPLGSLVKPFSLMALAGTRGLPLRRVRHCPPSSPETSPYRGCWYRPGHGLLDFDGALAHSCNHWFMSLVRPDDWPAARELWERVGFEVVDPRARRRRHEALVGGAAAVRATPRAAAAAYGALVNGGFLWDFGAERGRLVTLVAWPPDRARLDRGLRGVCVEGTGHAAQDRAGTLRLAGKTGTAADLEGDGSESWLRSNGWFVGWTPPVAPRLLVLVFLPGGKGSEAAVLGGEALARRWRLLEGGGR